MDDGRFAQPRGDGELPGENVLFAIGPFLQAELAERHDFRVVEVMRQPVEQVVDAVPRNPRRVQRERDQRPDAGHFETLGLNLDQLVPVLEELGRAAGARVARAGDGGFQAEIGKSRQILRGDAVGVEM